MPELPEMETYKRLLSENLSGKSINNITINREKSLNVTPTNFYQKVINQTIRLIERRGKHLIFHLSNGNCLLLHLMLGGWMYLGNVQDSPNRTKQVILSFGEVDLFFIGLRLGYLHLLSADEIEKKLADLGPEPLNLEFQFGNFSTLMKKKRGLLKTTLPDQHVISGIGNCYSDEICFASELLPTKRMNELTLKEQQNLFLSIKSVLNEAIKYGGYMENPLYQGDTLTGGFDERCKVYDREGEDCSRCGSKIIKAMISSRKTFYCLGCQK